MIRNFIKKLIPYLNADELLRNLILQHLMGLFGWQLNVALLRATDYS